MTAVAIPSADLETLQDRDALVAGTLPYLKGAYGNEAAAYLRSLGYTDDEILALVARSTLEA